ncbi:hypothetical protein Tco_1293577 [Tanacetum coccineum]
MAAVEVPQTLKYRGGQLNAAPVLEVENFTNWKKRFMCHIIGIKPQLENIISNGPFISMAFGQRKPEGQWTIDERKAANLDQRLKSLIMSVLLDDQMNYVINCLTAKSTWDDLILYHELVNDGIKLSKLEINTGFINGLPKKWLSFCQSLRNINHVKDSELVSLFDSPDDEEDTRSSHEYLNNLEEEYQARALLAKSKRDCWSKTLVLSYQSPFQPKLLHSSEHKPEPRHTKDFKSRYNKIKAKLSLLSSNALAPSSSSVKALMALADEERVSVGKESAKNGEWIKISMKKVHTLLEMEDNDDRKSFLDYLCIDLNYVEEQRNNLMSKHRNLVQELNTCKEQLLVLKQAKLDLLTMQHVNTEILKENQNLRNELKELTSITEAWLNISNKVNQCINEQIPTQKKKILGINQLTEDTSSFGPKDPLFVKSLVDNSEVSITGSNKPKLSEAKDSTLSNHDTGKHPLPLLEKLTGVEPVSRPKTVKSILKSKSTFKDETLKGITINKPSSAPARGNKSSLVSKTNSAPVETRTLNRKREALQAKKVKSFKASKTESSSALRSKTPTKRYLNGTPSLGLQYPKRSDKHQSVAMFSTEVEDIAAVGCYAIILWIKSQLTDYDIIYEKLPITIQFCTQNKNKAH